MSTDDTGTHRTGTDRTSTPRRLDSSTLLADVDRGDVRIIDVRTPAEFETAHIPSAHNLPLDALREHRDELSVHLDDGTVLVCRSGQRATQAEAVLREAGVQGVTVLEGGIQAWERAGGEVARGRQRWELERQVRLVAGSLVLGSVLASALVPGARVVAGFVGAGLTFAAVSDSCLMGSLLSRLPYNRRDDYDVQDVLGRLAARPDED